MLATLPTEAIHRLLEECQRTGSDITSHLSECAPNSQARTRLRVYAQISRGLGRLACLDLRHQLQLERRERGVTCSGTSGRRALL